jgi:hypothetical protein
MLDELYQAAFPMNFHENREYFGIFFRSVFELVGFNNKKGPRKFLLRPWNQRG